MISWPKLMIEFGRLLRFGVVGIFATLAYIVATMIADEWLLFAAVEGAAFGQAVSTLVSYFGHLHYSFGVKASHRVFFWRFTLISVAVLGLNLGTTWLITGGLGFSHRIAVAVVSVLIPATNYLFNRFWVFERGLRIVPDSGEAPSLAAKSNVGNA